MLAGFARDRLGGAAAGLFVPVALPDGTDEAAFLADARRRGFALDGMNEHAIAPTAPGLVLGFAAAPLPTLRRAIRELAAVG